jgi:hypothetical protein
VPIAAGLDDVSPMTTKHEQDRRNFVHTVEVLMASALAERDLAMVRDRAQALTTFADHPRSLARLVCGQFWFGAKFNAPLLAAARPPLARARMRARSSSAKADRKARIPLPRGVVRSSHCRSRALKVAARAHYHVGHSTIVRALERVSA